METQLSLSHSQEYLGQRNKVLFSLMANCGREINYHGQVRSCRQLLIEVLYDTELGQRVVWQSTLDTRVQL